MTPEQKAERLKQADGLDRVDEYYGPGRRHRAADAIREMVEEIEDLEKRLEAQVAGHRLSAKHATRGLAALRAANFEISRLKALAEKTEAKPPG